MRGCSYVLIVAFLATVAGGEPIELQIDESTSSAQVELCISSGPEQQCDNDTSRADGTVTIALDCPEAPSEVILHDFAIQLIDEVTLTIDFSFPAGISATSSNAQVVYGDPGNPLPPTPLVGGVFAAPAVPVAAAGELDFTAYGAVCFLLGIFEPTCDGTIDLATLTFDPIDVTGTLNVIGEDATLTVHVEAEGPIDPDSPAFGTFRVVGDATATGVLPPPCCPGDLTGDDLVALDDMERFVACVAGPGTPVDGACRCADLDDDGDTDLADYAVFSVAFTGP